MESNNETVYTEDRENKKIKVVRKFDAPLENVWKAWTESELLDQWWGPKPWKATTKSMDFRIGGSWLYYMEGPDGSRHYSKSDFTAITPKTSFKAEAGFCDENGKPVNDLPASKWSNKFIDLNSATNVEVEISYSSLSDMEKTIAMGFKDGFAAGHKNLDELLAK